jgi:heme oxygenase
VRRARLAADLAALGDEEAVAARPQEAPSSLEARLGGLYVVEGAALGGRLIRRRLSAHFGGSVDGALAFYAGEGSGTETGRRWRRFGAAVAGRLDGRPDAIEAAVAGAETTFRAFMAALAD